MSALFVSFVLGNRAWRMLHLPERLHFWHRKCIWLLTGVSWPTILTVENLIVNGWKSWVCTKSIYMCSGAGKTYLPRNVSAESVWIPEKHKTTVVLAYRSNMKYYVTLKWPTPTIEQWGLWTLWSTLRMYRWPRGLPRSYQNWRCSAQLSPCACQCKKLY